MSRVQTVDVTAGRVAELVGRLAEADLAETLDPLPGLKARLRVAAGNWGQIADIAARQGLRWSAVWGDHRPPQILIRSLLFGCDGHLLLETAVDQALPELTSQVGAYIAADRPERALQDMFGVRFIDHPDRRRWLRHQGWAEGDYPLRVDFPVAGRRSGATPPDCNYPFPAVAGEGVYEIPVGPVHAGIIEPGHFRFQAVGETILRMEEHLGYVHKGIEKIAVGRDLSGLARLACRVSGDSAVAHGWAACQAAERALQVEVPPRAQALRAILAERERIANHLGDIGAICNDVGFAFAQVQMTRLREQVQRQNQVLFGHRLLFDRVVPGGAAVDLNAGQIVAMAEELRRLQTDVEELLPLLLEYPSLQDRLRGNGILPPDQAWRIGVTGYIGRASNLQDDLRRDAPYAPYDRLRVEVPAYLEGDVAKRVRVRGEEVLIAIGLIEQLLADLPDGALRVDCPAPRGEVEGIGLVEGWRGETVAYVRLSAEGRVLRYFPRDPSWLSWPALEVLLADVIVPDFPVNNKSVNGSYSGHDL
ncbi:Ni,Fe-hydrogenase III large subunit [Geothermobacter hydrogeniphilus]|uniref:Ni,Fe-hydrogenase III large subunit n=1 Tax=Geothermobacter hydrogeniphilus TaxID=1969733 RepID=A0A2K2H9T7_9BACT|nr:NADH-quinone oxidoreductase subunit C [Geothermobacter hydrogeniphilus]PNU20000.1 Ni,Fe-hydrogenase III large subunit [Geothermobacter hydrogeniphilus]